MAARSENGRDSHAGFAASAASMAFETSEGLALEYEATAEEWLAGLFWVEMEDVVICKRSETNYKLSSTSYHTSLPPTTIGTCSGAFF